MAEGEARDWAEERGEEESARARGPAEVPGDRRQQRLAGLDWARAGRRSLLFLALRPHPPVLRPAIAPSSLRAALPPAAPPVSSRPEPAPALALRQASFARDTDSARPRLARAWIPPPSSYAPRLRPPPPPPLPRGRWTRWGKGGDLLSNANTRPHHQSNSFSSPPFQKSACASGLSADINRTEKEAPPASSSSRLLAH